MTVERAHMTERAVRLNKWLAREKRHYQLYLLLVIPVVYILVFCYWPLWGAQIAFRDYTVTKGITGSDWVGFKQFAKFFNSYQFERVLSNTVSLSLYSLAVGFPMPIILALSLNIEMHTRFKKVVQMTTYAPYFISMVVLVSIMNQLLSPNYGAVSMLLKRLGYTESILGNPDNFRALYSWSGVWQGMGWGSIIYISALTSIDPALHEAAIVDGADRFRRIWHIDLPGIRSTMVIMLILNAGNIMNIGFEKVLLMQNSMNLRVSQIISTYLYEVSFQAKMPNYSYATAIGLFNSVVNFILILLVNRVARMLGQSSLW